MIPDLVFFVGYECPSCHAPLEARVFGPPAWHRCPSCGRAGLPPDKGRAPREPADLVPVSGTFVTGPGLGAGALPIRPRAMAPRPPSPVARAQTTRLMLGSGFFLTMFLFLFSLLEGDAVRSTILGVAAAIFLLLLARPVPPARE